MKRLLALTVLLAFVPAFLAIGAGADIDGRPVTRQTRMGYVDGEATTVGDVADFATVQISTNDVLGIVNASFQGGTQEVNRVVSGFDAVAAAAVTNAANIATNASAIAANAADIATNADAIAVNAANIVTNAATLTAHEGQLQKLVAATNDLTREKRDFKDLRVSTEGLTEPAREHWTWTAVSTNCPQDFLTRMAEYAAPKPQWHDTGDLGSWANVVLFRPDGRPLYVCTVKDGAPDLTEITFQFSRIGEDGKTVDFDFFAKATRPSASDETPVPVGRNDRLATAVDTSEKVGTWELYRVESEFAADIDELRTNKVSRGTLDGAARPLPPYLHALDFDDSYPEDAAWYYGLVVEDVGRCSARRTGGVVERNYDWHFDDAAEFVVRVSHSDFDTCVGGLRFASVGVATVGTNLTENAVTSGKWSRFYKALPGHTVDGINERGVVAAVNVVGGEWPRTSGDIHALGAVRWALDHATSAGMAASNLAARVYVPAGFGRNFHYMLADERETWIVENGEAHAVTGGVKVLTNFPLYPERGAGEGQERYDALASGASVTSQWWTATYTPSGYRPSDLPGLDTNLVFRAWAATPKESHRGESFGGESWWQTVHTSVYDISNRVLRVAVQETPDWYTFAVPSVDVDLSPVESRLDLQALAIASNAAEIAAVALAATNYTDAATNAVLAAANDATIAALTNADATAWAEASATNSIAYLATHAQGGGGLDASVLTRTNMAALADDVSRTNGSIVGRIEWLEKKPDFTPWDLEFITAEDSSSLPVGAYRSAFNLRSVTSNPGYNVTIPSHCFRYCPNLEWVDLASAAGLGTKAFANSSITSVTIRAGAAKYSGALIFDSCPNLTVASFDSVTTLGLNQYSQNMFGNCKKLTKIHAPNCTTLDGGVFVGCTSLSDISSLTNVTALNSTDWREGVFRGCTSLTDVSALSNVTHIGRQSFMDCTGLTHVHFPKVVSIDDSNRDKYGAFVNTSITNAIFDVLTKMGYHAFQDLASLKSVECPLMTTSSDGAFYGCKNLEKVYMPRLTTVSVDMFRGCTSLTEVESMTNVTTIGGSATSGSNFHGCGIQDTTPLRKVLYINGLNAFRESQVRNVYFPNCVRVVHPSDNRNGAFMSCQYLTNAVIPKIEAIECNMFSGCPLLAHVEEFINATNVFNHAFDGCSALGEVIAKKVRIVGSCGFRKCSSITNISLGTLENIADGYAFSYCHKLQRLDANLDNVDTVGAYTFYEDAALTELHLPSVRFVKAEAFRSCTSMTNLVLGVLTNVLGNAFTGTGQLAPGGVTISVKLTMEEMRAFPEAFKGAWNEDFTKRTFKCTDGTIKYDAATKTWVDFPDE